MVFKVGEQLAWAHRAVSASVVIKMNASCGELCKRKGICECREALTRESTETCTVQSLGSAQCLQVTGCSLLMTMLNLTDSIKHNNMTS